MKHVAFLRAVNVAGHGCVKMTDVCKAFEAAGAKDVRSYIQSGNIVFDAPANGIAGLTKDLCRRLQRLLGEEPAVMVRRAAEIAGAMKEAPFGKPDPAVKLYVAFLAGRTFRRPALPLISEKEALEVVSIVGRDAFVVSRRKKNGMYGFPNNFIEQQLGVAATTRNWATVTKIVELCRD